MVFFIEAEWSLGKKILAPIGSSMLSAPPPPPSPLVPRWKLNTIQFTHISSLCRPTQIYRVVATTLAFYAPLVFILVIYTRVSTIAWSRIHTNVGQQSEEKSKTKRILVMFNR